MATELDELAFRSSYVVLLRKDWADLRSVGCASVEELDKTEWGGSLSEPLSVGCEGVERWGWDVSSERSRISESGAESEGVGRGKRNPTVDRKAQKLQRRNARVVGPEIMVGGIHHTVAATASRLLIDVRRAASIKSPSIYHSNFPCWLKLRLAVRTGRSN